MSLSIALANYMQQHGCMSFHDFMEQALYHPDFGYYMNQSLQIGKSGDFVTAPTIGNLFAQLLAIEINHALAALKSTTILEYGAGNGALAEQLLQHTTATTYIIIEKSPALIASQKQRLQHINKEIIWLEEIPKDFIGVVVANELLDAFSVCKFLWQDNKLLEYFVTVDESNQSSFKFITKDSSDTLVKSFYQHHLDELLIDIPTHSSELNPHIYPWVENLAKALQRARVFIIDYGCYADEYYHQERNGTLRGYKNHTIVADVLDSPGLIDLTAHVDFSCVINAVESTTTLKVEEFTNLSSYLLNIVAHNEHIWSKINPDELKFLTMPTKMGDIFKVLVLSTA